MSQVFFDRRGKEKYADDLIPISQKGYFAVLVKDGKVLLTYPPMVDVPEFPGGTVSRREDFRSCLFRKLYEETGVEFMLDKGNREFSHVINYFAEDARPYGEFTIYEQTFIVYDASSFGLDINNGHYKTPENGYAEWVDIEDIFKGKTKINYAHWLAFRKLFEGE